MTYDPTVCPQRLTWSVYGALDDQNMELVFPSVFSIDQTLLTLTVTHSASNLAMRKELYGHNDYYFHGKLDDATYKDSSKIPFVINFLDECRKAISRN